MRSTHRQYSKPEYVTNEHGYSLPDGSAVLYDTRINEGQWLSWQVDALAVLVIGPIWKRHTDLISMGYMCGIKHRHWGGEANTCQYCATDYNETGTYSTSKGTCWSVKGTYYNEKGKLLHSSKRWGTDSRAQKWTFSCAENPELP